MKEYQATIGYKAVICITVKAETVEEAKIKALEKFKKSKAKSFNGCELQDDLFGVNGIVDIDMTWNMIYKE